MRGDEKSVEKGRKEEKGGRVEDSSLESVPSFY